MWLRSEKRKNFRGFPICMRKVRRVRKDVKKNNWLRKPKIQQYTSSEKEKNNPPEAHPQSEDECKENYHHQAQVVPEIYTPIAEEKIEEIPSGTTNINPDLKCYEFFQNTVIDAESHGNMPDPNSDLPR